MMNLYIRIQDGEPVDHPILEQNLVQAYPDIDLDRLPAEFAPFVRVPRPAADPGKYIVSAYCTYEWVGDQVQDIWHLEQQDLPEE
jgi:hypothetical protein